MRILVTAFDPFGGDDKNSSLLVLDSLPDRVAGVEIKKLMLPTVYKKCAHIAWSEAKATCADAILCLGQAGGRRGISVEVIGVNYACSKMQDNEGCLLDGVKLSDTGEPAIFSTLPVKEMVKTVRDNGFEADLSLSAGGFVCNSLLYMLLEKAHEEKLGMPVGFVHLPYAKSQSKDGFSMEIDDMTLCVLEMIKTIANN